MSNANLKPSTKRMRINPGNRRVRLGFMTLFVSEGVEIALFHPTMFGLENAFNAVAQGCIPFDRSQVSRVEINNQTKAGRP